MTERAMYELLAACLRNQAQQQQSVNPAYARELRARAAVHARAALSPLPNYTRPPVRRATEFSISASGVKAPRRLTQIPTAKAAVAILWLADPIPLSAIALPPARCSRPRFSSDREYFCPLCGYGYWSRREANACKRSHRT